MGRHRRAAEHQQTMMVEVLVITRRAEALEIFRRCVGVEMHREQLALNEVGLRRQPQANRNVGFAHRQIELELGRQQRDADVGIEFEEFAEPRRQPAYAEADGGLNLQFAVRLFAAVGQLGARRLQLHEHFMSGAVKHLALFGQDQPARVAVEEWSIQLLLQRADLTRYGRLREAELFTRMGEAASLRGGMKNLQLVPVHLLNSAPVPRSMRSSCYSAASRRSSCAARKRSAS